MKNFNLKGFNMNIDDMSDEDVENFTLASKHMINKLKKEISEYETFLVGLKEATDKRAEVSRRKKLSENE